MDTKRIQQIASDYKKMLYDDGGEWKGNYIGIRVDVDTFGLQVGDVVIHKSSVWCDGEETDEKLNGICAVNVADAHALKSKYGYMGNVAFVLECNNQLDVEFGEDDAEIIMENPIILAIIIDE